MAIGIVNSDEFEQELARLNGIKIEKPEIEIESESSEDDTSVAEIVDIQRGRGSSPEVPESLREIIATDAIENGNSSAKELTRAFGISDSSLSAYKNGSTSTASYHSPDQDLKSTIDDKKLKISNKAKSKLMTALSQITREKLENAKLRDIAGVASAMSAVIKNMERDESDRVGQTNFIFYAPKPRSEDAFEVIDIRETEK